MQLWFLDRLAAFGIVVVVVVVVRVGVLHNNVGLGQAQSRQSFYHADSRESFEQTKHGRHAGPEDVAQLKRELRQEAHA